MHRLHVIVLLLFSCLQLFGFHVIPKEHLKINPRVDANSRTCSPPRSGDQSYKRTVLVGNATNQTISKRMILPQPGQMAQFMVQETESSGDSNYPIIWAETSSSGDVLADFNTATFVSFQPYIRDSVEFSLGTGGLKGCTVLAIISRRAVYIAHYWESIVFAPDEEDLELYGSMEKIFDLFVKKGLEKGVGRGQNKAQDRLAGEQIDDEFIRAYLLVPSDNYDGTTQGYPNEWNKIKKVVNTIIPRLEDKPGEPSRWTTITYTRIGTQDNLLQGHRGRCLFKFDPQHHNIQLNKRRKKAMFWNEDNFIAHHNDEWD